ncbi:hypothetical protein [Paracoccus cavernae]
MTTISAAMNMPTGERSWGRFGSRCPLSRTGAIMRWIDSGSMESASGSKGTGAGAGSVAETSAGVPFAGAAGACAVFGAGAGVSVEAAAGAAAAGAVPFTASAGAGACVAGAVCASLAEGLLPRGRSLPELQGPLPPEPSFPQRVRQEHPRQAHPRLGQASREQA